ncbi:MAG: hypothetical protein KF846_11635 [Cyclobacteriaceae bacterium]|nr:hypothetical protein [Cyclobacteriaceae bacterium]MBX2961975.1 hypothetical protein [Cyclobacteriaceae bacterium]
MRSNIWMAVTMVIGFLFAIGIVCATVLQLKKLEFAHQEAMADKDLAKEILKQKPMEIAPLNGWNNFKSTLKKVAIEICPSFITKFLGF